MRKCIRAVTLLLTVAGLSACTHYDDYGYDYGPRYGDYWYDGDDYYDGRDEDDFYLARSGADVLDPWLALTDEGRDIVATGFDGDNDGRISDQAAESANIWFRHYADTDDDLRLTDEEIRLALVQGALYRPWERGY
jgi:hypothetical protein